MAAEALLGWRRSRRFRRLHEVARKGGWHVETTTEAETNQGHVVADRAPATGTDGRRRRKVVLIGASVMALGLLLIVGALVWRLASEEHGVAAGANLPVNQDPALPSAHNSPRVLVNPLNPKTLVVAGRVDRPDFSAGVHVSRDAGRTWAGSRLVLPPGEERAFEPQIAFDAKGTLFVLFSTLDGQGVVPNALWLEGSRDGGRTFSRPVKVAGPFAYQPRLALDRTSGNFHVTWVQATDVVVRQLRASQRSPRKRTPGFGAPPNPVVMATSRDGGATFSRPVRVSESTRDRVGAATPVVGPKGDVYVLYQDYGDNLLFQGVRGPVYSGRFSLVMARSTDAGRSFSTTAVVDDAVVPWERFLVYLPKFPSVAVDRNDGTLHVAWSSRRNGDPDIFVRRSDDRGKSWSKPVRVGDDKPNVGQQQYLPTLSVAPNGRVDLLYVDRSVERDKSPTAARLATSFDKGETWGTIAASDDVFDSRVGPRNENPEAVEADPGSNLGLDSTADAAYAVWADSRRGTPATGKQDLYFAPIRIAPE